MRWCIEKKFVKPSYIVRHAKSSQLIASKRSLRFFNTWLNSKVAEHCTKQVELTSLTDFVLRRLTKQRVAFVRAADLHLGTKGDGYLSFTCMGERRKDYISYEDDDLLLPALLFIGLSTYFINKGDRDNQA